MNEESLSLVRRVFREYYAGHQASIWAPTRIERREFGFFLGRERLMTRHIGFQSRSELAQFVVEKAPFDAYYSVAEYDFPWEQMDRKGWRRAELAFDIDADHLPHACGEAHDFWLCGKCGAHGKLPRPPSCLSCRGSVDVVPWVCEKCLGLAKGEVFKLLEVLVDDLGASEEGASIYFSGHRGYHVHVETEELSELDQMARKEIADYLTGTGLNPALHGFPVERPSRSVEARGPVPKTPGWGGRVSKSLYETVLSTALLQEAGLEPEKLGKSGEGRKDLLNAILKGDADAVALRLGMAAWRRLLSYAAARASVGIDPAVTSDVHRLFRLPESLNSKTGFLKRRVEDLASFNPMEDAVAISGGRVRVRVSAAPQFSLRGEVYGPFDEDEASLPLETAVFLVCKGVAEVLEA